MDNWAVNCVLELIVFALVEVFTKNFFPGRGCPKFVLLSSQLAFLVISAVFIMLHHRPYLLLVPILGVIIRLISICFYQNYKKNQYLSSPLPNAAARPLRDSDSDLRTCQVQRHPSPSNYSHSSLPVEASTSLPTRYNVQHKQDDNSLQRKPLRSSVLSNNFSLLEKIPKFTPISYFPPFFVSKSVSNPCPPGLQNLGNTCFINSTLQCLIWIPGFIDNLSSVATQSNLFVTTLLDLMLQISSQSNQFESVCSSEILDLISQLAPHLVTNRKRQFRQSQQDSAEFLLWLLNHIHTETLVKSTSLSNDMTILKEKKLACLSKLSGMKTTNQNINMKYCEYSHYSQLDWDLYTLQEKSPIYEQFLGQFLEERECQLCNKLSLNTEYFIVLPIPLPKSTGPDDVLSLDECFTFFHKIEDLTDTNMIACSCVIPNAQSLTPGTRRSFISKTPSTLIIQLSRYSYNMTLQTTVKNKACVQFNTIFEINESQLAVSGSSAVPTVYKLVGVCVHSGADNTSYGHYVAYCLTSLGWCYFNDETVSRVTDIEETLRDYFILQNAYLLFYSRL